MPRFDDRWWPPPSRPRPAKGGIRSRSRRGAFAESWWSRRWIEVLEGFRIGARLGRGRSYARKGQVLDIQVEPGEVTARVQGSRTTPYRVTIALAPLSEEERRGVAGELARRARLSASLLNGEMPRELEEAFADADVPLFPERHGDLETDCSCPDWSNPCKHIAAVYYLVAEELDRNPFLLLRLRGFARGDLVEAVGGDEGAADGGSPGSRHPGDGEEGGPASGGAGPDAPEPLPSDPERFWRGTTGDGPGREGDIGSESGADEPGAGEGSEDGGVVEEAKGEERGVVGAGADDAGPDAPGVAQAPAALPPEPEATPAVHLRALGRIPFWRGETDPESVLTGMMGRAVPLGMELLAGAEPAPEEEDDEDEEG